MTGGGRGCFYNGRETVRGPYHRNAMRCFRPRTDGGAVLGIATRCAAKDRVIQLLVDFCEPHTWTCEVIANRVVHELDYRIHPKFAHDRGSMRFNGLHADA